MQTPEKEKTSVADLEKRAAALRKLVRKNAASTGISAGCFCGGCLLMIAVVVGGVLGFLWVLKQVWLWL